MKSRQLSSSEAPDAAGGYAQALEISAAERLLFVSGQIPVDAAGRCPPSFGDQCRQVWANLEAQLRSAGMSLDNLVKVTIYLSDRRYAAENRDIRQTILGARSPALTVIITGIFDESWLLEIEALAAA